jgi:hypothetical protein
MSYHHRGIYIELLSAAWDSDEPGTLPLPIDLAARSAGLDPRSLRDFMAKSPGCFVEVGGRLVNIKLRSQYQEHEKFIESKRVAGIKGNAVRWHSESHSDRSASASASASAINTKTTSKDIGQPTPLAVITPTDRFEDFWNIYPKKVAKAAAKKAWAKILGADEHYTEIILGTEKWKASGSWSESQFIPYPANFLNQRRWEDEVPMGGTNGRADKHVESQRITLDAARRVMARSSDKSPGIVRAAFPRHTN